MKRWYKLYCKDCGYTEGLLESLEVINTPKPMAKCPNCNLLTHSYWSGSYYITEAGR